MDNPRDLIDANGQIVPERVNAYALWLIGCSTTLGIDDAIAKAQSRAEEVRAMWMVRNNVGPSTVVELPVVDGTAYERSV